MKKYLEISADLEHLIQTSVLKEGTKIDSIRKLVKRYKCSNATIIRALIELENRHLIYVIPQSGFYVVKRSFGAVKTDGDFIDFVSSAANWKHFPYIEFQHCINRAFDTYQQDLFRYGTSGGLPPLIHAVKNLLESYQVFCSEKDIIVCSGVQQALNILCQIPFPNGKKTILIEEPGYHLFIQVLKAGKMPVATIKRGIDISIGVELIVKEIFRQQDTIH